MFEKGQRVITKNPISNAKCCTVPEGTVGTVSHIYDEAPHIERYLVDFTYQGMTGNYYVMGFELEGYDGTE